MKHRNPLALIATIVTLSAGSVLAQAPADEVEQVLQKFLIPFSNQDIPKFIDYFADDASVFFPSARFSPVRVEGKANIASAFGRVFTPPAPGAPSGRLIQPQDLKVQRFGDSAIVTFHLGSDTARSRRTFVLMRIAGQWKIVHLHASSVS